MGPYNTLHVPQDQGVTLRHHSTRPCHSVRRCSAGVSVSVSAQRRVAIGSDNVNDSSLSELEYLQGPGIFDNLTLLKMWAETTPRTIFPNRRIGALREGYEASFLALVGNPVEDLNNVRKIRLRFKQGFPLEP